MPNVNTILVIDDDPIASLIMERANHKVQLAEQVHCFYSAVDGLDYLSDLKARRQKFPEIIFLDICMPIVSGWQFLEQLAALGETDTSVYMLASSTDQEHINRAKNVASVKDYIVKPITVERLRAIKNQRVDQASGVPAVT
jgi:CheY-like chemotaxis protein